jgi:hypothetical protein
MRKAPDIWGRWGVAAGNGLHIMQLKIALQGARLLKVGARDSPLARARRANSPRKPTPNPDHAALPPVGSWPALVFQLALAFSTKRVCTKPPPPQKRLPPTPREIPIAAAPKVGGRMVYSTCTFNPVEDEAVVAELLVRWGGSDSRAELRRV